MGATKSCMSLKTFESLKLRLTKDRCPFVITATGTSMEPIGFTECSFEINGRSFTQKFIVCNNQTRPIILGKDFASKNCIGIVWTKQGSRKMIDDDCKVIMEIKEQTRYTTQSRKLYQDSATYHCSSHSGVCNTPQLHNGHQG